MIPAARIDHLVVAADTLAQGVAWCERTLGVTPGPGGTHPLMGTHNRLLRIATVDHPRAYLEIIAPDPSSAGAAEGRQRWFDLDDPALRESLRTAGPRLVHWVAQVQDVQQSVAELARLGIDRGEVVVASRATPRGLLQWRISVRRDGQRLFDGCLPTLIQWDEVHPAATMPASGVTLHGVQLSHPRHAELAAALAAIGLEDLAVTPGAAALQAFLQTPAGALRLASNAN